MAFDVTWQVMKTTLINIIHQFECHNALNFWCTMGVAVKKTWWTNEDERDQKLAIDEMQRYSLQQVHIEGRSNPKKWSTLWKDQLSPEQLLFSGAHVGKLFKPSTLEVRSDRLCKELVVAERKFIDGGSQRRAKFEIWLEFENLHTYLTGLSLSDEEINTYKTKNWELGSNIYQVFWWTTSHPFMVSITSLLLST